MIQEVIGGASSLLGETKISFNGVFQTSLSNSSPSPSPNSTNVSTTTSSTNPPPPPPPSTCDNNNNANNNNNNLRCPRCDSSNTKFCYYNNYNLTQPRHFCKTCRRYWTKGGALRNVPIGGGCRKNKTTLLTPSSKSSTPKSSSSSSSSSLFKTISPDNITSTQLGFVHPELPYSNPILWPEASSSSSSSHLLALLRATSFQNPNPNPNHNPISPSLTPHLVKEENDNMAAALIGSHQHHHLPSLALSTASLWGSNNQSHHQNGTIAGAGDAHNNLGMQQLYERLIKSSSSPTTATTTTTNNNYFSDHHQQQQQPVVVMSNGNSSSSWSSMLESAPVGSSELGYYGGWNVNPSWSHLPTKNGAYP